MHDVKDNDQRAFLAKLFMYFVLGTSTLLMLLTVVQVLMVGLAVNPLAGRELIVFGIVAGLTSVLYFISVLAAPVFFILWFYRSYNNLYSINRKNVSFPPAQAIWIWFVPFLNLIRPREIMAEVWDMNQHYAFKSDPSLKEQPPNRNLLNTWWGLWLFSSFLSGLNTSLSIWIGSIGEFVWVALVGIVGQSMAIGAALAVIRIVTIVREYEKVIFVQMDDLLDGKELY